MYLARPKLNHYIFIQDASHYVNWGTDPMNHPSTIENKKVFLFGPSCPTEATGRVCKPLVGWCVSGWAV